MSKNRVVTVNGLTLHYLERGCYGPPALLLPGYGHACTMWERPLKSYLQEYYHCYVVDLPGHGASDKPPLEWYTLENFTQTLYHFCLTLTLQNILLIGYSMGGLLAINLALHHSDLIANLVTINAPIKGDFLALFDPLLHLENLVKQPFAEQMLKIYTQIYLLALPVEWRRYAHTRMLFSQSSKRVQTELAQCTVQSLFGSYKMIRRANLSQQLPNLQVPMLVITSAHDKVTPPEQGHIICRSVGQAQLAIIERSGHLPLDEQPDLFDAALKEYLKIHS